MKISEKTTKQKHKQQNQSGLNVAVPQTGWQNDTCKVASESEERIQRHRATHSVESEGEGNFWLLALRKQETAAAH